ncbi:DUF5681 domain-containing protein [Parasphingorhabdus sp.]|uniref:DUF5681 domain-containing protein n=1 Tax=Parasphingorhabdus sp. TaxID=2709688 RepID=UPI0030AC814B
MSDASSEQERLSDTDAVGYGNPPKHSQFKKGQSGNAKGRPRGKRNMASLVGDVLAQKVTVTANGKRKRVSSETALLLRLREKALGGDLRALQIMLSLRAAHIPDADSAADHGLMAAEDIAILASAGLIELPETNNDGA